MAGWHFTDCEDGVANGAVSVSLLFVVFLHFLVFFGVPVSVFLLKICARLGVRGLGFLGVCPFGCGRLVRFCSNSSLYVELCVLTALFRVGGPGLGCQMLQGQGGLTQVSALFSSLLQGHKLQ